MAKRMSRAILPRSARPQKRNAASAELMAEMEVTVPTESLKYLLSLRKPKNDDAAIPGILMRVMSNVEKVCDNMLTLRAYSLKYVCGIP